jgi:GNAT superfamily N-acetyltransferase
VTEELAVEFFNESGFAAFSEFDAVRCEEQLGLQVERQITPHILCEVGDRIVGFISYSMEHSFTKEPIAIMWTFYITPKYRRGPYGRMLLSLAMHMAQGEGACAFFATVAPTTQAALSLCNLLRHEGFDPMGGAYMRRL